MATVVAPVPDVNGGMIEIQSTITDHKPESVFKMSDSIETQTFFSSGGQEGAETTDVVKQAEVVSEDVNENVRVVVRCRPMNEKEIIGGFKNIVQVDAFKSMVIVENPNAGPGELPKTFSFDAAFGPGSKQTDVYNRAARVIIDNVLQGYNGTIFAYGQTGTGKTFTMEGTRSTPELKGIIPNSFAHIFGHIAKARDDKKFLIRVSYLEIYNEEVRDLISTNQSARLEVKERPDVGVYVRDLTAFGVSSADHMDRIMTIGNRNRAVGTTKMNEMSSRSHAIFTIYVECGEHGREHVRMGKLHLVDLAGSERQSKTGSCGQTLKEATKINLSLSTLGNVISALVDGKSTHVPYRNSKLTRLLQDSLGGNSRTIMCANIGPADYNYDETISTLRYANRAKSIQNKSKINEDPKDALLRQFQKEIEDLRRKLHEECFEGANWDDEFKTNEAKLSDVNNHKKRPLSEERMESIRTDIDAERKRLTENEGLAEEERRRLVIELEQREDELEKTQEMLEQLVQRELAIEKKILVGGENLLEKAEEQERLLQESAHELEERRYKEVQLRLALQQKEAERLDIEEKYTNLQEEASGKTKKLKKVWTMLVNVKSDLNDVHQENQRETEGLLENVRQLSRELKLQMLVIDSFIPTEYQDLIERHVHWNEEIGEWQLKCVAYTGNNMRKQSLYYGHQNDDYLEQDMPSSFLSYLVNEPQQVKPVKPSSKSTHPGTDVSKRNSSPKVNNEKRQLGMELLLKGII